MYLSLFFTGCDFFLFGFGEIFLTFEFFKELLLFYFLLFIGRFKFFNILLQLKNDFLRLINLPKSILIPINFLLNLNHLLLQDLLITHNNLHKANRSKLNLLLLAPRTLPLILNIIKHIQKEPSLPRKLLLRKISQLVLQQQLRPNPQQILLRPLHQIQNTTLLQQKWEFP